jgi:hypothetical protein
MRKLAIAAGVPALALVASAAFGYAPAAQAATAPTTAKVASISSMQDQTAYNTPNNDLVTISDTLTFGAKTTASVQTLVDGKVAATLKSATYSGTVKPTLARVVEAGGSKHAYEVKIISTKGATLASSKAVTYTATRFPAKVAPKTITGPTEIACSSGGPCVPAPPWNWTATSTLSKSGSTPLGMTLTLNGDTAALTGTPAGAGTYPFTLIDANSTLTVTITVTPVAPNAVSITGITSKQDMPTYTSPNNDFVTVLDSVTFGTKTVASIRTTVDGTWVQSVPVTYAAGSSVADSVVAEAPNSTHFYTVQIIGGSALLGPVLATSGPVTYAATLFPPVPPPVTDPLVCTGAVQYQGNGGEGNSSTVPNQTGIVLISVTRDGQEVTVPAGYKLSFVMPQGTVTLLSPDPLRPPTYSDPSLYLPGATFTQVGQTVTLTSNQALPATNPIFVGAGISFWFTGPGNMSSFDDPITLNGQACQMTSIVG